MFVCWETVAGGELKLMLAITCGEIGPLPIYCGVRGVECCVDRPPVMKVIGC